MLLFKGSFANKFILPSKTFFKYECLLTLNYLSETLENKVSRDLYKPRFILSDILDIGVTLLRLCKGALLSISLTYMQIKTKLFAIPGAYLKSVTNEKPLIF